MDLVSRAKPVLRLLLRLRPLATLIANLRAPFRVILYRQARLSIAGPLSGKGRLAIGKCWPGQVSRGTEVAVRPGGAMCVDGIFALHRGVEIRVSKGGRLTLGSGYLADDVRIDCHQAVTIGHRVAIAARTVIMDTDHHDLTGARARTAPVVIGDDVWIGMGAMILKGVTIGSGAVIAAGSIVVRDVAPGMLVAGSPARDIRPVTWSI